jgi:hypothetical protein
MRGIIPSSLSAGSSPARNELSTLLVESQEVSMGKLTAEQKVREYNRGKKPQVKVGHVHRVSLGRIHSNPINIMKNAERRSTRAME